MRPCYLSLRHLYYSERASVTGKLAISLLAYIVVILVIIELACVAQAYFLLHHAISKSARYAYTHSTTITESSLKAYATQLAPSFLGIKMTFIITVIPQKSVGIEGNLQHNFMNLSSLKINMNSSLNQPLPPS